MSHEKIQKLKFKNNNNESIKIFFSTNIKLWYNGLVKTFLSLFNNCEICNNQDDNVDIVFYDK